MHSNLGRTCKPILLLSTCAGGAVAPESRAAAKNVPVDCIENRRVFFRKVSLAADFSVSPRKCTEEHI